MTEVATEADSWLDGLDEPEVKPAPLTRMPKRPPEEKKRARSIVKSIKDELFNENAGILMEMTRFKHVDPTQFKLGDEPDQAFLDQFYGGVLDEDSEAGWRVALASWMPKKEAPVALLTAASIATGIMKSDAVEKSGPKSLNVAVVMGPPIPKGYNNDDAPVLVLNSGDGHE